MPAPPSPRPTLAVVVPASDAAPSLDRCTAAIARGERQPDELIVQREPRGAGPAWVRNAGAAQASADILVFVDSDVEVHPDALERIERCFAADPSLAAVFGAYDDDPAAPGLTSRFRNLLHHQVHASSPGPAETFWAGLGAVRRDVFREVGGFDARRFPVASIEDVELGLRMRAAGARLLLDPDIRGRHLKAWTPATMVRTDFARRGVPWTRLLLRGRGGASALNLGWRHRASAAVSTVLAVSILARRPRLATGSLLAMLALNHPLYALLARHGGPGLLVTGVGLHVVHHLTAVAAFLTGAAAEMGRLCKGWLHKSGPTGRRSR